MSDSLRNVRTLRRDRRRPPTPDEERAVLEGQPRERIHMELVAGWRTILGESGVRVPIANAAAEPLGSALQRPDHDQLGAVAQTLQARALADALLKERAAWPTWVRACDLLSQLPWVAFANAVRRQLDQESPSVEEWMKLWVTGTTPEEQVCILDGKREIEAAREVSRAWRTNPTGFDRRLLRSDVPLRSGPVTALALLRAISPSRWFEALRTVSYPPLLAAAIEAAADSLDEILSLLAAAPVALGDGASSIDVAAVHLGRLALAFPTRAERELESRVRAARPEVLEQRKDELEQFRADRSAPMIAEIVERLLAREDGQLLSAALLCEGLSDVIGPHLVPRDQCVAEAVLNQLASSLNAATTGESIARLLDWSVIRALAGLPHPFVIWLADVLVASSSVANAALTSADASRLLADLPSALSEDAEGLARYVAGDRLVRWTFSLAGLPFARTSKPGAAFRLCVERLSSQSSAVTEHEGLGVLARAALASLILDSSGDTAERVELATVAAGEARRIWLRGGAGEPSAAESLARYAVVCLAMAGESFERIMVSELRCLATDPRLACETAALLRENGIPAETIRGAFAAAERPLATVLQELDGVPAGWRPSDPITDLTRSLSEASG